MPAMHRLKIAIAALVAVGAGVLFVWPMASARAVEASGRVGLIVSDLPQSGSAEYKALRDIAGEATSEALEMTRSEMWSVASERVPALKSAARAKGVTVRELDESWNTMMTSMPPGSRMTKAQKGMMNQAMESNATMGVAMMALPPASTVEYALTKGMHDASDGELAPTLVLPLNKTTKVTARRTSVTKTNDGYVWHGVIEETDDMVTLLWWPDGRLSGTVNYKGHMFAVKPMGGEMHGVVEMSSAGLPPEHAPMGKKMMKKMQMREDPLVHKGDASELRQKPNEQGGGTPRRGDTKDLEDAPPQDRGADASGTGSPGSTGEKLAFILPPPAKTGASPQPVTITLIVAYTKQAASHYSDIDKDLIALAIEEANQSFRNSGLGQIQLEVVHSYETGYVESGSHFDHVFRFADKGDGYMEEVHALRDQYHADVGLLIVHDPRGCGLSAGVAPPSDRAFAVVHHECAATMYSLAHEIGHIIGARHDMALDDSVSPFPFGHGFVNGTKWRTMMSYKDSCDGCPRLPIWSNPAVLVRGVPAGDNNSDNARVIAKRAAVVAGFR